MDDLHKTLIIIIIIMCGVLLVNTLPNYINFPTKEQLSNQKFINMFCKEKGYEYGVSYYAGNLDEYTPAHDNSDILSYKEKVVCIRTVKQSEIFDNAYYRWAKNKIIIPQN